MKKIAIVGTQGVPAQYGGFETLVEYLIKYLGNKIEITVFASSKIYGKNAPDEYKGVKMVYVPFNPNGALSVVYDSLSLLKSCRSYDKVLVLGASGGLIFPLLKVYREKFILNFGGLDWGREKWGRFAKWYLKKAEKLAIKNSAVLVADNKGIQEYIKKEYNRDSVLIAYGGDQVRKVDVTDEYREKFPFLSVPYILDVARIQADNNIEMILKAFEGIENYNLVIIGNWANSFYGQQLKKQYEQQKNIWLLDPIYDQKLLNVIRGNAFLYIHGHSAGGTNPALVEAMSLGLPIYCYNNGFNNYTTENQSVYFNTAAHLHDLLLKLDATELKQLGLRMQTVAARNYTWENIANKYMKLFL